VNLRHEHVPRRQAQLAATLADVIADRRLGDIDAVLVDQAPPHALGGVTLLARRLKVCGQPLVDDLAVLAQLRRAPPLRRALDRRDRRGQRLPDGPTMHAMALGKRPDRQALPVAVTPDLLKLLHP